VIVDEEILQDFLVEAMELVEQLNEMLIDLEKSPDDTELLNAVFRAFHTIKGGAGFLGVKPLIEVCHRAENVFDKIRNGEVAYDDRVADAILRAFDVISDYINALNEGQRELEDADPQLLAELDRLTKGESAPAEAAPQEEAIPDVKLELPEGVDPDGEISDDEFEALLQQRDQVVSQASTSKADNPPAVDVPLELPEGVDPDGEISDDEFEALLMQRDGLIQEPASTNAEPAAAQPSATQATPTQNEQVKTMSESTPPSTPSTQPKPGANGDKPKTAEPAKTASSNTTETTVRVDTRRLDEIMNLVGELVLVRNRLLTLKDSKEGGADELATAVANLDHVTTDLQNSVMKTRMQPVKKVFGRFPRVVRDLARKLGKEIELELRGEETDLDKNLVEALADPLVHLVRNSVDHGIEMPDERERLGKPRVGKIILEAKQEGDHILLSITDDGKGMDPDMLRRKAVEKGLMDEVTANQLSDEEAFQLIMAAGFSTAETVSDISGRGVGMDVVKNMISKLNGSIEIHSVPGEGTQMIIRVPLTLAILPTLMVTFGIESYAIPLTSVQEIFDFEKDQTNNIDGQMMIRLREKSIPLFFLTEWLSPDIKKENYDHDKVVIVSVGNQRVGLVVDQVDGQEEVVIKPLGVMLRHIEGYAGATITGNGNIALILDLPGVIQRFQ
jgi:two-component system chemotaxis sensor kinase CheA